MESLSPKERLVMETAKMIREDFLFQNAFDEVDAYASLEKQYLIMKLMITFHKESLSIVEKEDFDFKKLSGLAVKPEIAQSRMTPENDLGKLKDLEKKIKEQIHALR
jgi:V/A-type H+-transporting ATPase subunit A